MPCLEHLPEVAMPQTAKAVVVGRELRALVGREGAHRVQGGVMLVPWTAVGMARDAAADGVRRCVF